MCHTLLKRQPKQTSEISYYLHEPVYFILGKMHFQLFFWLTILLYLCSRYSSVEIKPELQKNILKFGYGLNYKYVGMLPHSFDRFYIITKFILPTLDDLRLYPITYDKECQYLRDLGDEDDNKIKQNIKRAYCVWFHDLDTLCMHTACIEYYGMCMCMHIGRCWCTCALGGIPPFAK